MQDALGQLGTLDLLWFFIPKILIATVCGGMVGLEREIKHKVAGMKTNIMICVGATLFASIAFLIAEANNGSDPTRIISQIVGGIGFLGAGAIFRANEKIRGLTSASLIWVLSGVGIMIASGIYLVSILITLGLVGMIFIFSKVEQRWFKDHEHD